jgi:transposase
MSIRSVHSPRTVRTNRSAIAFIRGTCGAVSRTSTPTASNTASNAAVNFASRSRIRWVKRCPVSWRSEVKSRTSCVAQAPVGYRVTPNRWTWRVRCSITKATYSRVRETAQSTWKKSIAKIDWACALKRKMSESFAVWVSQFVWGWWVSARRRARSWCAGAVGERKAYKTDLTDAERVVIEPLIAAWKARHPSVSGHQGRCEMREIVNALRYRNRTDCQWELLPHDLPPTGAVRCYFDVWKRDGLDRRISDVLRMMVRERAGRNADPSPVVLDSQSVRAAAGVPKPTTGLDAAEKTPGRRRRLAVDAIGLIIAVVVVAASAHDNAIGTALLNRVAPAGTVRTALVGQGFKAGVVDHGRTLGIDVQIVERNPTRTGFVPEPIRRRVEQANGLNMLERRLARDYEHAPSRSESRIYRACAGRILRRLAGTPARWREV